jgi:hypothetical protein
MAAIEWVRKVISVRRGVGGVGRIVSQSRLARASSGVTDIDAVDEGHEIQQHDEGIDAQRRLARARVSSTSSSATSVSSPLASSPLE